MALPIPLETERLRLRLFNLNDAPTVQRLAGDWDVAKTTVNIPHPYEEGMAEQWIERHLEAMKRGDLITLAVALKDEETPIGAVALGINTTNHWAELGYWIGKPYWNKGYCTEAVRAVIAMGFQELKLNRIQARHLTHNPASGRVMQKCGMALEGTLRQIVFRFDAYHDLAMYSVLREEYVG